VTAPSLGPPPAGGLARAVAFESSIWRSLFRWLLRRPGPVPPTDRFGYDGAAAPLIWVFVGLSAVEIPILDLLLPGWWRLVGLAVGLWALLWMLGLLGTVKTHPHLVDLDGIRIRYGSTLDIPVPWDLVDSVAIARHQVAGTATVQMDGSVLIVAVTSQTNVELAFTEPVVVAVPKTRGEPISAVRFYADDPVALLGRVRSWVDAADP